MQTFEDGFDWRIAVAVLVHPSYLSRLRRGLDTKSIYVGSDCMLRKA
jgi:hypothetical protein